MHGFNEKRKIELAGIQGATTTSETIGPSSSDATKTLKKCEHPHSSLFELTGIQLQRGRLVECCIPPGYFPEVVQKLINEQFTQRGFHVGVFSFEGYARTTYPVQAFGRQMMAFFGIEWRDLDDQQSESDSFWPLARIPGEFLSGRPTGPQNSEPCPEAQGTD